MKEERVAVVKEIKNIMFSLENDVDKKRNIVMSNFMNETGVCKVKPYYILANLQHVKTDISIAEEILFQVANEDFYLVNEAKEEYNLLLLNFVGRLDNFKFSHEIDAYEKCTKAIELAQSLFYDSLCDDDEDGYRICSVCGRKMTNGYCYDGGAKYYCSDKCLHYDFTDDEWREECVNNEDSYWTEWSDD